MPMSAHPMFPLTARSVRHSGRCIDDVLWDRDGISFADHDVNGIRKLALAQFA
jgi:hypothetical protein